MRISLVLRYLLKSQKLSFFAVTDSKLFAQPNESATASSLELDIEEETTELKVAISFYYFDDLPYPIAVRISDESKAYFTLNNLSPEAEVAVPITQGKDPVMSMGMTEQNSLVLGSTWFSLWKKD